MVDEALKYNASYNVKEIEKIAKEEWNKFSQETKKNYESKAALPKKA